MFAPLADLAEYTGDGEERVHSPVAFLPVPVALEPVDYRILALLFQGLTIRVIADNLQRHESEVYARCTRPRFVALQRRVEHGVIEQITRTGEVEPLTIAKANAGGAMRRIVVQSKTANDPRVYLAANREVLRMAGVEPARRFEIVTPDQVLEQMTPDELSHFASTREWPVRFKDSLAQFIKTGDGEVTMTETKTVTVKSGASTGKAAKVDPVDEELLD